MRFKKVELGFKDEQSSIRSLGVFCLFMSAIFCLAGFILKSSQFYVQAAIIFVSGLAFILSMKAFKRDSK